jgi:hypothetical protein
MKGPILKILKPFHVHCVFVSSNTVPLSQMTRKKTCIFSIQDVTTGYNTREHLTTDEANAL